MKCFLIAILTLLAVAPGASAIQPGEMLDDLALEARAREVGKQLRCLVCQNQSIFDSNAGLAHDLRMLLRERLSAGDTDDEALAYVADRYGDYVLLNPPVKTHTAILWVAPFALLLFAFGVGAIYLRRREPLADDLDAEDLEDVRKLLARYNP